MSVAYEQRLRDGLSFFSFMRMRFARLYPMVLIGALIGCVAALFRKHDFGIAIALVAQLAFVPFAVSRDDAYPLNNVQWSLFFELFINGVHGLFNKFLSTPAVAAFALASGLILFMTDRHFGALSVGYSWSNFIGGFSRVAFSYSMGIVIYRIFRAGGLPHIKLPYPFILIILTILFGSPALIYISDSLFVIVVFPLILSASLTSTSPKKAARVISWAGGISYPLYSIHVPLLQILVLMIPVHSSPASQVALWTSAAVLIVATATGLEYLYDAPIRRWLARARQAKGTRDDA